MKNESKIGDDVESAAIWIADLAFQRHNRSLKYVDNGDLLILSEMSEWEDIYPRIVENYVWICVFSASIFINFVLFFLSFAKGHRQLCHKKVQCLIANLAFCNVILSAGFLVYTFLVDVYYDVDSFNTLIKLNEHSEFASLWPLGKQFVHVEMVENFALAQGAILATICIDRYLSLLEGYSAYLKSSTVFVVTLLLIPYMLALVVFDYGILRIFFDQTLTIIIKLCALMTPSLLSAVLMSCILARLLQMQNNNNNNNSDSGECSTSTALTVIIVAQTVEKFGLFLELMKYNFMFELIVGEKESDEILRHILATYYQVSHTLFLLSPLYSALLILLLLRFYRNQLLRVCKSLLRRMFCRKRPRLDYSSETMRSIIAEQNRARQLRMASIYSG